MQNPLIHCITHPITINDSANGILAVGARPIMCEHPGEAAAVTAMAGALAINLGNITDVRLESMAISGRKAKECGIPSLIDLVGITCSPLRMEFAKSWIADCRPAIIKGNMSEIKAMCGLFTSASGIDAAKEDQLSSDNTDDMVASVRRLSASTGAVILATGKRDLISDCENTWFCDNGTPRMGRMTGTGCLLGAIAAAFLPVGTPMEAALYATALMGVSGELADAAALGMGSFHVCLLDQLDLITDEILKEKAKLISYQTRE